MTAPLSTSALGAVARSAVVAVSVVLAAAFVFAPRACGQEPARAESAAGRSAAPAAGQSAAARSAGEESSADETFELDIPLRRIAEEDFIASTEVTAGDAARGLRVRVGAFVRAERVELLLRNVRGSVRFRASLGPLLRLLDAPRATAGESAPPAAPSP